MKKGKKSSEIGGQAVMEGIMMKNKDRYAIAVRKPNQSIIVESKDYQSVCKSERLRKLPFVRGIIQFVDSLVLGMSTLSYSASFFEEEETDGDGQKSGMAMGLTIALAILLAVGIFMALPFYISQIFQQLIHSQTLVIVLEGVLRLAIFILYILLISRVQDIQRVFMYHGAEHKCINCIENGLELTPENVKKSSKEHKRCGTSFLFVVLLLSIVATMFIRVDSQWLKIVLRLLLIPVIAGVSYEFIRLAGNSDHPVVNVLSKPGLWLQALTTKEPEADMIEVGIASVEAVFDWRNYIDDKV